MKGSCWMVIVVFLFQLFQAPFCAAYGLNAAKYVRKDPAYQARTTSAAQEYDFLFFVQQWSFTLCDVSSCLKPARASFIIYGLWPSLYPGQDIAYCGGGSKFVPEEIAGLEETLNIEWPSLEMEDNFGFWQGEWERHGVCSETVLPQREFFKAAITLKKEYRIIDMLLQNGIFPFGDVYRLDAIAEALRAATGHEPQIKCDVYNQVPVLSQVFLCFNYNATRIIDCPRQKRCQYDSIVIPFHS